MNASKNVELAVTFLTGLVVGGACSWTYVRFLKATIRFYEQYIQERIDRQLTQMMRRGVLGTRA
ncbi:MAG TPA: hypothetical protein VJV74_04405 [Terriglobia bacterium]|nr:hypothetical protein [Terriglobia bacterium]